MKPEKSQKYQSARAAIGDLRSECKEGSEEWTEIDSLYSHVRRLHHKWLQRDGSPPERGQVFHNEQFGKIYVQDEHHVINEFGHEVGINILQSASWTDLGTVSDAYLLHLKSIAEA